MNFGKWLGIGGIKDFPYDIGDVEYSHSSLKTHWQIRKGTRSEDGLPVSIFEFDKKASTSTDELVLATNGMKKSKTLMLPGMLKCYDTVETPTALYVATEPCMPLTEVLGGSGDEEWVGNRKGEFIAFGLYTVINALHHLHSRSFIHANCHRYSIYVTKSGDWKLWNLDFVTNLSDPKSAEHFKQYANYLRDEFKPPELAKGNWSMVEKGPTHAIDSWGLACLFHEIFNEPLEGPAKPAEMKTPRNIPRALFTMYSGLLSQQPRMRTDPAKLLECEYFTDNTYISVQQELDRLNLKDPGERDSFFRKLAKVVDDFPTRNCKYTILPKLTTALQFGAGGASALEPILRIGGRLDDEEYTECVVPGVIQLFASNDALVRMKLLQNVDAFVTHLPAKLMNDVIWGHLSKGFTHHIPEIRELTIKAMIPVVPLLKEKLVDDVARLLCSLQVDREGGIRTNATICLGKVSQYLPSGGRVKILVQAFLKVLKDPFFPARLAGLNSFTATAEFYPAEVIAKQILPTVVTFTVDPEKQVRQNAFKCIAKLIARLEEASEQTNAPSPAPAPGRNAPSTPQSGEDASYLSWAMGAVSKFRDSSASSSAPAAPTTTSSSSSSPPPSSSPAPQPETPSPVRESHKDPEPDTPVGDSSGWGDLEMDEDEPVVPSSSPPPPAAAVEAPVVRKAMTLEAKKPRKKGLGALAVKKTD